jgi:hypothetical protein
VVEEGTMSMWFAVVSVVLAATPGAQPEETVNFLGASTEAECLRMVAEETHRELDGGARSVNGGCVDIAPGGGE